MLKRFWTLTVVSAILVLAVVAAAKTDQKVMFGDAVIGDDNLIRVPVTVANGNDLVGIDLAFKYSAGVRIKEVTFENTRVSYWDLKPDGCRHDGAPALDGQETGSRRG